MKALYTAVVLAAALAGSARMAAAGERALVVGIGHYGQSGIDLPGIDLDVAMARRMLKLQGFKDDDIKVLTDAQATAANITLALRDWLGAAGRGERAVFYFSGHGTRIPSGGEVESALVAYDVRAASAAGRAGLSGVIRASEFTAALRALPSSAVYAYIDACNSGGMAADKSLRLGSRNIAGIDTAVPKFFAYPGMPQLPALGRSKTLRAVSIVPEGEAGADAGLNFVALLAAEQDQYAVATSKGSAFTLGIAGGLDQAMQDNKALTPLQLTQSAAQFIRDNVAESRVHTPILRGSMALKSAPLAFSAPERNGDTWIGMATLASRLRLLPMTLTVERSLYNVGERVQYSLNVPRDGYLNIITIDANDQATLLFPNPLYKKGNFVSAGQLKIPGDLGGFAYEASAPRGKTLTVAILTARKLDLLEESIGRRDSSGKWLGSQLGNLTASGASRAVRVVDEDHAAMAGQVQFDVR